MFEDINEISVKPKVGNSTKPLLYAGTVDLVECSIGIQNLFLFFFKGGKFKNKIYETRFNKWNE